MREREREREGWTATECFHGYLLHIDLDVLLQAVAVKVEDEVVDQIQPVTDDDEGQLISQFGLLQEVLHSLRIVAAALTTYPLHLLHLTCLAGSLREGERSPHIRYSPHDEHG